MVRSRLVGTAYFFDWLANTDHALTQFAGHTLQERIFLLFFAHAGL